MLTGRIDRIANNTISGWAYNSADTSERLMVRVERYGEVVASIEANGHRRDLEDAGIGDGGHAFSVDLPKNTDVLAISVVAVSETGAEISLTSLKERELDIRVRTLGLDVQRLRGELATALSQNSNEPDGISTRISAVEARLDASEVFLMRLDEMLRKIIESDKKKRKRWLGIF